MRTTTQRPGHSHLRRRLILIGIMMISAPAGAAEPDVIEAARSAAAKAADEQTAAQAAVDAAAAWLTTAEDTLATAQQSVAAAKSTADKASHAASGAVGDAKSLAQAQADAAAAALAATEQAFAAAKSVAENAAASKTATERTLAERVAAAQSALRKVVAEQAYAAKMKLRQAHGDHDAVSRELAKKNEAAARAQAAADAAGAAANAAAQQVAAAEKAMAEKSAAATAALELATAEADAATKQTLQEAAQRAEQACTEAVAAHAAVSAVAKNAADAAQAAAIERDRLAAERSAADADAAQKAAGAAAATQAAVEAETAALDGLPPIAPGEWSHAKARHLLFRAGFGGTPEEVERLHAMGLYAAVDYLVDYHKQPPFADTFDPRPIERGLAYESDLEAGERNRLNEERVNGERYQQAEFRKWWLRRMVETARPLEEKLTLFWHDHFATGYEDKFYQTEILYQQNQLLRKYADKVDGLLRGIVHDPAMILYLDNQVNVKGRGNENLGREVLELFTLGRDQGYTEQDLRELARALTGYSYVGHTNQFRFNGSQFDEGPKTILGQTGPFSGDEAIDIILQHPSSARYAAKKLFEFFAHRNPDEATIERLAHVLRTNSGDLAPMLTNLFRSQAFYSERAVGQQIKSPVELMVGTIRLTGMKQVDYNFVDAALQGMGQTLYQPPNVGGWEEGRAWISANRILLRYNGVAALVEQSGVDLAAFMEGKAANIDEALSILARSCLGGEMTPRQRQEIASYLNDLPPADQWTAQRDTVNPRLRAALVLLMSTPEYQLN
jgi:hypothetical protein